MKVLKFGGSSVANAERITAVIQILNKYYLSKKIRIAVVFSAMSGVTDNLIRMASLASQKQDYHLLLGNLRIQHFDAAKVLIKTAAEKKEIEITLTAMFTHLEGLLQGVSLLGELSPRTLDLIQSFGERLNCVLITNALRAQKIHAEYLDASHLIKTDSQFGNARVHFAHTNKLIKTYFKKHNSLQIITGFIGSDQSGLITTLGRGGSDYTASIFGAALSAGEIEIWTDVDGVLSADPRKVKDAFSLPSLSYEEAMELSHFGAKVIYPPTMVPALEAGIDLVIKNTFRPEFKGTYILHKESSDKSPVKGISSIDAVTVIKIQGSGLIGISGTAARVFKTLASEKVNVILITQASSEHSICIAVSPGESEKAVRTLNSEFASDISEKIISEITAESDCAIIAVVGENMRHTPGIAGRTFHSLGKNGINIIAIAQGSSELNISLVIPGKDLAKALNVLHEALFISRNVKIHLYVAGVGLVGKELVKLIAENSPFSSLNAEISLTGLCNSKKMIVSPDGIPAHGAIDLLQEQGEPVNTEKFIHSVKSNNLAYSVFVDCTANLTFIPYYQSLLSSAVSVVTPNKIANTQSYQRYTDLRYAATKYHSEFRYATNVGAALPIITVMKDLIENGDEITKIEGVLSGTLSFLFNEFNKQENSFSELVRRAKSLGYTEPDPRDDLSGLDVARKLLILVREIGKQAELEDIKVTDLVSKEAKKPKSTEAFFTEFSRDDDAMNTRLARAKKNGKKLIYLARYENGKASAGPVEIGYDHPFFHLQGTDTIIAISSRLHSQRPLIIQGQGAGARYTAFGVLLDIFRIKR